MATDDLLSQNVVARIIGGARLLRLVRAGWLVPAKPANGRTYRTAPIFYAVRDVHAVIKRFERGERPPPDWAQVVQVRASEIRHGHAYVRKKNGRAKAVLDELNLDELLPP